MCNNNGIFGDGACNTIWLIILILLLTGSCGTKGCDSDSCC